MIDTRLKVFCSVARNLSFTKASRELHISQPAISKHIHELENEYNVALFERLGTRIELTHAGELLLSHAEKIIDNYRSLNFEMNLLSEQHVGELRLGASTTIAQYVLPPFLASFAQKFRQIKVSLLNGNTQEIEHAIDEHRIDLGLVEGRSNQPHLHYIPFMKDELVLVVNAQSKLAALDEITLDELKEMPLVIRENGSGSLEVLKHKLSEHNIRLSDLNVIMQLGSTESIKLFIESTECAGIISIQAIARDLYAGKFKIIEITNFCCERSFSFVQHIGQNAGIVRDFMRYVTQNF